MIQTSFPLSNTVFLLERLPEAMRVAEWNSSTIVNFFMLNTLTLTDCSIHAPSVNTLWDRKLFSSHRGLKCVPLACTPLQPSSSLSVLYYYKSLPPKATTAIYLSYFLSASRSCRQFPRSGPECVLSLTSPRCVISVFIQTHGNNIHVVFMILGGRRAQK